MNAKEAVAKRIIELCKEKGITINGIANLSAIPPSTVKSIIYGVSKNPGIVTIKMICDGFDISLPEFFDSDFFYDLEQEIK